MGPERSASRTPAVAERRPAVAVRAPVAAAAPAGAALQQRLGNQGAQAFATQVVARSCAPGGPLPGGASNGAFSISHPADAHEREAEHVADVVMRSADPALTTTSTPAATLQRACAECEEEMSAREHGDHEGDDATHVHRSASDSGASQVSAPV